MLGHDLREELVAPAAAQVNFVSLYRATSTTLEISYLPCEITAKNKRTGRQQTLQSFSCGDADNSS